VGTTAAEESRETIAGKHRVAFGPMTEEEIRFLRDVQAYIDFAIRNGLGFGTVLGDLSHDINGIALYHGFSPKEAREHGFLPMVNRYSEVTPDSVGEPAESTE